MMKEIMEMLDEYEGKKKFCLYWIHECEKDLVDEEFESYEQYHGCKLALQKNKDELEKLYEKIDILKSALKILNGEKDDE